MFCEGSSKLLDICGLLFDIQNDGRGEAAKKTLRIHMLREGFTCGASRLVMRRWMEKQLRPGTSGHDPLSDKEAAVQACCHHHHKGRVQSVCCMFAEGMVCVAVRLL